VSIAVGETAMNRAPDRKDLEAFLKLVGEMLGRLVPQAPLSHRENFIQLWNDDLRRKLYRVAESCVWEIGDEQWDELESCGWSGKPLREKSARIVAALQASDLERELIFIIHALAQLEVTLPRLQPVERFAENLELTAERDEIRNSVYLIERFIHQATLLATIPHGRQFRRVWSQNVRPVLTAVQSLDVWKIEPEEWAKLKRLGWTGDSLSVSLERVYMKDPAQAGALERVFALIIRALAALETSLPRLRSVRGFAEFLEPFC
jgi:uncharacterized protein YaeQ